MSVMQLLLQLIGVYKVLRGDWENADLVSVFSDVFVWRGFPAEATAEPGRSECSEEDRQRQFDSTVSATKAETRG